MLHTKFLNVTFRCLLGSYNVGNISLFITEMMQQGKIKSVVTYTKNSMCEVISTRNHVYTSLFAYIDSDFFT